MLPSNTNGYRVDEMIRRSEAGRQASEAARVRRGPRLQGVRRLGSTIATLAMWPLRH
jgi:hypothetical protein